MCVFFTFFISWPACWAYACSGSLPLDLCIFSCVHWISIYVGGNLSSLSLSKFKFTENSKGIACAHDDHLGKEKIPQQPISTVTLDVEEYNIFSNNWFRSSTTICQTFQVQWKKRLFVRTISLRCYNILMQLFMLLSSGRNAVVHPCKTFRICCLWSAGEGTIWKCVYFSKNLMCDFWSSSPRSGDAFNRCQWNLARRMEPKVSLYWPNVVLLC